MLTAGEVLGLAAAALAGAFSLLLMLVGREQRASRLLALLLVVEGSILAAFVVPGIATGPSDVDSLVELVFVGYALAAFGWLAWLYVRFLAPLETTLARPLRSRTLSLGVLVVAGLVPSVAWVLGTTRAVLGAAPTEDDPLFAPLALGIFGFAIVAIYAVMVSLSAWSRAPKGTIARRRAAAFAAAFVTRDVLFAIGILSNFLLLDRFPDNALVQSTDLLAPVGTLLYVPLLAYGILRTQLFDLDLRIKIGISRGTVASIILVTVFVLAKIVESYLNRTAGFVAGSIVAGALLFLVPKLNKVGDKVANTAMPNVAPTPVYVQFKKLEVYRAAVEAAHETGGLGARERASLDRLRGKLGLDASDCAAVEAEVAVAPEAVIQA